MRSSWSATKLERKCFTDAALDIRALLRGQGKSIRLRYLVVVPKTSAGFSLLREILLHALDLAVQVR
jgi:hypothetical protein